jgi:hypothetical protein
LALNLAGCTDYPKDLDGNLERYEQLAKLVSTNVRPGQIIDRSDAEESLKTIMSDLDVSRVRHELDSSAVLLSGASNILTGQFSYLYRLGEPAIDLEKLRKEGREVNHLHGRWYSEKAYFD